MLEVRQDCWERLGSPHAATALSSVYGSLTLNSSISTGKEGPPHLLDRSPMFATDSRLRQRVAQF